LDVAARPAKNTPYSPMVLEAVGLGKSERSGNYYDGSKAA
jgi:hypothetical protein